MGLRLFCPALAVVVHRFTRDFPDVVCKVQRNQALRPAPSSVPIRHLPSECLSVCFSIKPSRYLFFFPVLQDRQVERFFIPRFCNEPVHILALFVHCHVTGKIALIRFQSVFSTPDHTVFRRRRSLAAGFFLPLADLYFHVRAQLVRAVVGAVHAGVGIRDDLLDVGVRVVAAISGQRLASKVLSSSNIATALLGCDVVFLRKNSRIWSGCFT